MWEFIPGENKAFVGHFQLQVRFPGTNRKPYELVIGNTSSDRCIENPPASIPWYKPEDNSFERAIPNANQWVCAWVTPWDAFRLAAINQLLIPPWSNTIIPILCLAIAWIVDSMIPSKPDDEESSVGVNFLRILQILIFSVPLLILFSNHVQDILVNSTSEKTNWLWNFLHMGVQWPSSNFMDQLKFMIAPPVFALFFVFVFVRFLNWTRALLFGIFPFWTWALRFTRVASFGFIRGDVEASQIDWCADMMKAAPWFSFPRVRLITLLRQRGDDLPPGLLVPIAYEDKHWTRFYLDVFDLISFISPLRHHLIQKLRERGVDIKAHRDQRIAAYKELIHYLKDDREKEEAKEEIENLKWAEGSPEQSKKEDLKQPVSNFTKLESGGQVQNPAKSGGTA